MGHSASALTALLVAISVSSLVGVAMVDSTALWLGWSIATIASAGALLLWSNWGREPPTAPT